MKLVHVSWADSMTETDWRSLDDIKKRADDANALHNETVGYLLLDEADYVLVAQTWTPGVDGDKATFGNTTQIPRSAVVSVKHVTVGRRRG